MHHDCCGHGLTSYLIVGGVTVIGVYIAGLFVAGPTHSPFYALFGVNKPKAVVKGYVAPGYEKVKEEFTKIMESGYEECSQTCAYVDGVCVVDLYGIGDAVDSSTDSSASKAPSPALRNQRDNFPYNQDTIQNVFSCTKVWTSIVIAMLVDRGHLRYDMKVADIWPGFLAQHAADKADITVEDVCKHEAGLFKLANVVDVEDIQRDALKRSLLDDNGGSNGSNGKGSHLAKTIGASKPKVFKTTPTPVNTTNHLPAHMQSSTGASQAVPASTCGGRSRAYHAVTRGWILNEIVMRVDPKHRTVGEFVRDEIAQPLHLTHSLTLGPESQHVHETLKQVKPLHHISAAWLWVQLFKVWDRSEVSIRSIIIHLLVHYSCGLSKIANRFLKPEKHVYPVFGLDNSTDNVFAVDLYNHPRTRSAEIPSGNGHANARALAKLANCMLLKKQQQQQRSGSSSPLSINAGTPDNTVATAATEEEEVSESSSPQVELLSQETIAHACSNLTFNFDNLLKQTTIFSRGGWAVMNGGVGYDRQGSMGWFGMGGSACQWHNETGVAFGYTVSLFGANLYNKNSATVQNCVINCARELQSHNKKKA